MTTKPLPPCLSDRISPEPNSGCWLWTGDVVWKYGSCTLNGKTVRAHRATWEHFNGPIPAGFLIDHKCRNKTCVNPEHLRLATPCENMRNRKPNAVKKGSKPSRFKGVHWDKQRGKWKVQVTVNGVQRGMGFRLDEIEAAKLYDEKVKLLHGNFAATNADLGLY